MWTQIYPDGVSGEILLTATAPIWDESGTTFLGVLGADTYIKPLSSALAKVYPEHHAEHYITEQVEGQDILVATSAGDAWESSDGQIERLPAYESSSATIASSYKFLADTYNNGNTSATIHSKAIHSHQLFKGNPFTKEPMLTLNHYKDATGDIDWVTQLNSLPVEKLTVAVCLADDIHSHPGRRVLLFCHLAHVPHCC